MFKKVAVAALLGACLTLGVAAAASAADPARLQVNIPKIDKAPVLDGKLDDAAWVTASIKGGKFISDVSSTGDKLIDYPRIAYVGYNSDALYVAYVMFAPDVNQLVFDQAKWWYNDEVEIILQPKQAGAVIQYGIVNNGTTSSPDIQAAVVKEGIKVVIEVAIPWSAVKASAPAVGEKWGLHLSGYQTNPKLWMSSSYASGFLKPEMMGVAVFGE